MQVDPPNQNQPFTILRIKRKRTDEPLDALVVESGSRKKKSRGGMGLFKYAQTVEEDAWNDKKRQKEIQEKISHLARQSQLRADCDDSVPCKIETASQRLKDDFSRAYTVVEHPAPVPSVPSKVLPLKGPENLSGSNDFKMFDAVPTAPAQRPTLSKSEMDNFLPLLDRYLRIHNTMDDASMQISPSTELNDAKDTNTLTNDDKDYVWDVFYHRPATLSEWNSVANIGTLTGLPASFNDLDDSGSDSEEELDEADEDSNAEEYYRNDYPDERDSDSASDEWHDGSEYDDMNHYRDQADDADDFD